MMWSEQNNKSETLFTILILLLLIPTFAKADLELIEEETPSHPEKQLLGNCIEVSKEYDVTMVTEKINIMLKKNGESLSDYSYHPTLVSVEKCNRLIVVTPFREKYSFGRDVHFFFSSRHFENAMNGLVSLEFFSLVTI